MRKLQLLSLCLLAALCCQSCKSETKESGDANKAQDSIVQQRDSTTELPDSITEQPDSVLPKQVSIVRLKKKPGMLEIARVNIQQITGNYYGYKSQYIVTCDYPLGKSPVAKALQTWINERINPSDWKESAYRGDKNDPAALFNHYAKNCQGRNGTAKIKAFLKEDSESSWESLADPNQEPQWQRKFHIKHEFENDHIVSYSELWSAFCVGNVTPMTHMSDATFRKSDGKQLSWDMFVSKEKIFNVIRKGLRKKFGDGADMYEPGVIPMPEAPLFLKDAVRFDYSDYSIGTPHYYDEYGESPSLTIPYREIRNLLTPEAKKLLGL